MIRIIMLLLGLLIFSPSVHAQAPTRFCLQITSATNAFTNNCIDVPANLTQKNYSITLTTANRYYLAVAASTNKFSIQIVNNNTTGTDTCLVDDASAVSVGNTTSTSVTVNNPNGSTSTITAAGASFPLAVGGSYQRYFPTIPNNPIVASCPTNGDTLYVVITQY